MMAADPAGDSVVWVGLAAAITTFADLAPSEVRCQIALALLQNPGVTLLLLGDLRSWKVITGRCRSLLASEALGLLEGHPALATRFARPGTEADDAWQACAAHLEDQVAARTGKEKVES